MSEKRSFTSLGTAMMMLLTFLAVGALLYACNEAEKPAEQAGAPEVKPLEPIRLAAVGPHSGDLASYGIPSVRAAQLVVAHRNSMNGVNGRKIELIIEDDVCKPEIATNTATKIVAEKVHAVLGHICSGATKAALGIYKDARIIAMSPSATNPALTQSGDYPNFYRTIASDDAQARLEVDFALDTLKLKKIAVLHDKGDYGKGLAEFAKTFLEKDPRAEVVLYEGITPGAVDYSAVVQKIKQSDAEAVIFGGYHPEASKIVSQMRKKGMDTIFISDDGVKDDTFIKVAGEYAEGVYATGPHGYFQKSDGRRGHRGPQAKFGEDPGAFSQCLCRHAGAAQCHREDRITDYDMLAKALHTEFVATPLGIIRFDERGDAIGVGFSMYQVQKGVYVEVG